jgi:hypothetical protein
VVPEALVLIGDEHVEEGRIDAVERRTEAPVSVRRGEGAQQLAVAVEHLGRQDGLLRQRRRKGAVEPPKCGRADCDSDGSADRKSAQGFA